MAIPHAVSGEVINVRPFAESLSSARTETLIKTDTLEVIRLVIPEGKEIARHEVPGELTLQCLEGAVELIAGSTSRQLAAGDFVYLDASTAHEVRARADASLLLTILLSPKSKQG